MSEAEQLVGVSGEKYLGDGVYYEIDEWGNVLLSTQRGDSRHYIMLEPAMMARLFAAMKGRVPA